jgi:DNA invertase Pin-like site-specific DNA recombinase
MIALLSLGYSSYFNFSRLLLFHSFLLYYLFKQQCRSLQCAQLFFEMEHILITERVKAGLDAAHSKGRKGGRPKALTPDKFKTLKSLIKSKEFSVTKICKIVGISRSVYYRAINNGL